MISPLFFFCARSKDCFCVSLLSLTLLSTGTSRIYVDLWFPIVLCNGLGNEELFCVFNIDEFKFCLMQDPRKQEVNLQLNLWRTFSFLTSQN